MSGTGADFFLVFIFFYSLLTLVIYNGFTTKTL